MDINAGQIFGNIRNEAFLSRRPDEQDYYNANRLEQRERNYQVKATSVGCAVLGGTGVGVGMAVGAKYGAITGAPAGPVGIGVGAGVGVVVGGTVGYVASDYIKTKNLLKKEEYKTWQKEEHEERTQLLVEQVLVSIDALIVNRIGQARNYKCPVTGTLILSPMADTTGTFYSAKVTTVQGQQGQEDLTETTACKVLKTDLLKMRSRFVEEVLNSSAEFTPNQRQALNVVQEEMKKRFTNAVNDAQAALRAEQSLWPGSDTNSMQQKQQLATKIQQLTQSKTAKNMYVHGSAGVYQITTY